MAGAFLIAWLTQVAAAAAFAFVHRQRGGATAPPGEVMRVALVVGTVTVAGLLAGVLPGWWLQARWAFATLVDHGGGVRERLRVSAGDTTRQMASLLVLGAVALGLSLLGQSIAAAVAEAAGTIVPTGTIGGRTTFALRSVPHVVTSVLAWWLASVAVTVHAVGVSRCHDRIAARPGAAATRQPRAWPTPARTAVWISIVTVVGLGLAAAMIKVQQHF